MNQSLQFFVFIFLYLLQISEAVRNEVSWLQNRRFCKFAKTLFLQYQKSVTFEIRRKIKAYKNPIFSGWQNRLIFQYLLPILATGKNQSLQKSAIFVACKNLNFCSCETCFANVKIEDFNRFLLLRNQRYISISIADFGSRRKN